MSMEHPSITYDTPADIGTRIRQERRKRGLTQAEFSQLLHISASYLGAMERGSRTVSSNMLSRLHDELHLSYDYLLEGTTLQDLSLQQYIREDGGLYGVRHDLDVVLGTCSEAELETCYELIHTYLRHSRGRSNQKIRRQTAGES